MTKSRSLIPLPRDKREGGGLVALEEPFLEDPDHWARKVLAKVRRRQAPFPSLVLSFSAVTNKYCFMALLQEALDQRLLTKGEIIEIYESQSEEIRKVKPFLDLHDLLKLTRQGRPLFKRSEIVALAERTGNVSARDVEAFMADEKGMTDFSVRLVKKWSVDNNSIDMLTKARIAEFLYRNAPEQLDRKVLAGYLEYSAKVAPKSGAVQIFLTIAYELEKKRKGARRDSLREEFAGAIINMVTPTTTRTSVAFFEAQKLLGWYLSNPFFSKEDKEYVEAEIRQHTDTYAKMYKEFIQSAKDGSAFSIR